MLVPGDPLQPIVRKDLKLTWPRIETKTHFIQVGFDEDLMKAFTIALNETVDFLTTSKGLDRYEAYSLASIAADCRISQVVDVRRASTAWCRSPSSPPQRRRPGSAQRGTRLDQPGQRVLVKHHGRLLQRCRSNAEHAEHAEVFWFVYRPTKKLGVLCVLGV